MNVNFQWFVYYKQGLQNVKGFSHLKIITEYFKNRKLQTKGNETKTKKQSIPV